MTICEALFDRKPYDEATIRERAARLSWPLIRAFATPTPAVLRESIDALAPELQSYKHLASDARLAVESLERWIADQLTRAPGDRFALVGIEGARGRALRKLDEMHAIAVTNETSLGWALDTRRRAGVCGAADGTVAR